MEGFEWLPSTATTLEGCHVPHSLYAGRWEDEKGRKIPVQGPSHPAKTTKSEVTGGQGQPKRKEGRELDNEREWEGLR